MGSIFQCVFASVMGVVLALFGVIHSVSRYPGAQVFGQLMTSLPALGSVLFFALGILAAVAGLVMLVLSQRRLRHRWRYLRAVTSRRDLSPMDEEREWNGAYR